MLTKKRLLILLGVIVTLFLCVVVGLWGVGEYIDTKAHLAQLDLKVNSPDSKENLPIAPVDASADLSQSMYDATEMRVRRLERLERFLFLPLDKSGRRMLDAQDVEYLAIQRWQLPDDWNQDVSIGQVSTTQLVRDAYTLQLPLNANWGNAQYAISPYEERDGMLSFGPISYSEMRGSERYGILSVGEKRTFEQVLSDEDNKSESCGGLPVPSNVVHIGKHRLVRVEKEYCEGITTTYILPGQRHNYSFSITAWSDEAMLKWVIERFEEKV